jgi:hypothetical protein
MYRFSKWLLVVAVLVLFIVGMPGTISAKPAPGMAAVDNAASAHDRRAHHTSHIRHRRRHHAHH